MMHSPTAGFENRHQKVLFVRFSSLGDVVLSMDIVRSLMEQFPRWHLTWLVETPYAPLVRSQPFVSEVLPWSRQEGVRGFLRLLRHIRSEKFDMLLSLQGGDRAAFLALASGIPLRYGDHRFLQWIFRQNLYWILGIFQISLFPRTGAYMVCPDAPLPLDLLSESHPLIVLAVGASHPRKCWPLERVRSFVDQFLEGAGTVVLTGSGQEEESVAAKIIEALPPAKSGRIYNFVGRLSLEQLAVILGAVDLVVSGDTGPLHIARALGTPVLGLWGPTRLAESYMVTLDGEVVCSCPNQGCRDWTCALPCMETIAPETVLKECRMLLSSLKSNFEDTM